MPQIITYFRFGEILLGEILLGEKCCIAFGECVLS